MTNNRLYLNIAENISNNSPCVKRKVGALIKTKNGIMITGFNHLSGSRELGICEEIEKSDSIKGISCKVCLGIGYINSKSNKIECKICNGFGYYSITNKTLTSVTHAEEDAILTAYKHHIDIKDSILYCTYPPCLNCANLILDAKISKVIIMKKSLNFKKKHFKGIKLLKKSNIEVIINEV
jgi:dCMP deaminase